MIKGGRLEMDSKIEILAKRGLDPNGRIQKYIDSEVLRRCAPFVPRETSELIRSGTRETVIGSGEVIYDTLYARRWYYMPAKFQGAPKRGNYWFDRMLNEGGREQIFEGIVKMSGGKE